MFFVPSVAIPLGVPRPRSAGVVAFLAENRPPDLGLKRYLIVLAAIVANDLEAFWGVVADRGLFCAAFRAPLWSRHVPLVKNFLILF